MHIFTYVQFIHNEYSKLNPAKNIIILKMYIVRFHNNQNIGCWHRLKYNIAIIRIVKIIVNCINEKKIMSWRSIEPGTHGIGGRYDTTEPHRLCKEIGLRLGRWPISACYWYGNNRVFRINTAPPSLLIWNILLLI